MQNSKDATERNLTNPGKTNKLIMPRSLKAYVSDVEIWSRAMGIYEPCQVGNKAALSRTSHVPRVNWMESLSDLRLRGFYHRDDLMDLMRTKMRTMLSEKDIELQMKDCTLCPRNCHVNRLAGQTGFCGAAAKITAARAALHFWEEPCISGTAGSGTVFFSGCNLKCVFCQNQEIALGKKGMEISPAALSDIFLRLQEQGANNINLVTPTHFIPQICLALQLARQKGLSLPIVYNSSGYEEVSALRMLDGMIDIYLPDMKYFSSDLSKAYSRAEDYFVKASLAIAEMYRQVGTPSFDASSGLLKRGLIVRHLLLPGQTKDSKKILRYLHETYGNSIYISIMNQYTPLEQVRDLPQLNRPVSAEEYKRVLSFAEKIGIENGYYQDGDVASESFIPAFDYEGILPG